MARLINFEIYSIVYSKVYMGILLMIQLEDYSRIEAIKEKTGVRSRSPGPFIARGAIGQAKTDPALGEGRADRRKVGLRSPKGLFAQEAL